MKESKEEKRQNRKKGKNNSRERIFRNLSDHVTEKHTAVKNRNFSYDCNTTEVANSKIDPWFNVHCIQISLTLSIFFIKVNSRSIGEQRKDAKLITEKEAK
jgi:hypothetical protein